MSRATLRRALRIAARTLEVLAYVGSLAYFAFVVRVMW